MLFSVPSLETAAYEPDLLALAKHLSGLELGALARADQRHRWLCGQRVPVEVYLERLPALGKSPEAVADLAYNEFMLRRERDESPSPEEYLARFPAFAEALRRQFALDLVLASGDLLDGAGAAGMSQAETLPPQLASKEPFPTRKPVTPEGSAPAVGGRDWPRVPNFEIVEELGRGGMGVVYKARQISLNRVVALKMILAGGHASAAEVAHFRTEAEAIARLQHANIVQVYEVGEHEGKPFFSLEFCPKGSLDGKLAGNPQPPHEAAHLVETLARAMHAAHQQHVIHRDLKPANVLLAEDGTPKITDFGLARKLDEAGQTSSGAVMGTPSYMAPEQASGKSKETGPGTDVYALGTILYEMLVGRPPFKAATQVDTLLQVIGDEPVPPRRLQSKTPRDLETICLKCLRKDPARRYPNAETLAEDLRHFRMGEPIRARPAVRMEWTVRWMRRRPAMVLAAVAALAVVFVVSVFSFHTTLRMIEANSQVTHTHKVLTELELLLSLMKDAETGQRGYLLTGQKGYLMTYNGTRDKSSEAFDRLRKRTEDNPGHQRRLDNLKPLIDKRFDELQETISLHDAKGKDAALEVVKSDVGKRIMDDARAIIGEIGDEEKELLKKRDADAASSTRLAQWSVVVVGTAVIAFVGMFMLLVGIYVTGSISRSVHESRWRSAPGRPEAPSGS